MPIWLAKLDGPFFIYLFVFVCVCKLYRCRITEFFMNLWHPVENFLMASESYEKDVRLSQTNQNLCQLPHGIVDYYKSGFQLSVYALLCSVIGLQTRVTFSTNQKQNQSAWRRLHAFALNSDWFIVPFAPVVIAQSNRPFSRWRHFTTTTRIHFVFPFKFKFCNPRREQRTIALISKTKQKTEGFW